jgi:hypothetical protein
LSLYDYRAVANGLSTDHPIPNLPFVDDSHIPADDPEAVEATGRNRGSGMWGRHDTVRQKDGGGWLAWTTDPLRNDLAWIVRWHPDHGRSVVLYRDHDASPVGTVYLEGPLLFRAGAYWWDGQTWYRPDQVIDLAHENYYHRRVPGAATVTAASLLATGHGDPARGTVLQVIDVDPDASYQGQWDDDLALWAGRRASADLDAAVVNLTAPELAADRLVGSPEMASITGIAASTLRAYAARGEADLPLPQAVIGSRALWSRPVADEWAEARQRHPDVIGESVAVPGPDGPMVPVGVAELAAGLERSFNSALWDYRPVRSRWALRWRNPGSVGEVAASLAARTASYVLRSVIPGQDLIATVANGILWEFAEWQRGRSSMGDDALSVENPGAGSPGDYYPVGAPVARMYGWLVRHDPGYAQAAWGAIVRDAEAQLGIPVPLTERSLDIALGLDGKLDEETLHDFLRRVKRHPPTRAGNSPSRVDPAEDDLLPGAP